ncbi:hypothetical protein [Bradyrhizobium sp. 144]|uniref:hypothetical protein n=1 Tax=Bradyrhizobium sp. 144 TaxID=2782620 RepID=UPI001FFA28D1|nr:hypothetical protein [Bradyrhizobium sp. 144]MCK1697510.1 hypothetical protein [Bradyrhizobium sp. 144]
MTSQTIDNPAGLQNDLDHGDQLPTQTLGTAELLEMFASRGYHRRSALVDGGE